MKPLTNETLIEFRKKFVTTVPDPKHIDYGREVINEKYPKNVEAFILSALQAKEDDMVEKFKEMIQSELGADDTTENILAMRIFDKLHKRYVQVGNKK